MICVEWSQFAVPAAMCDWCCCKAWLPLAVNRSAGIPFTSLQIEAASGVTTLCMPLPTLTNGFGCGYVQLELLQGVATFHSGNQQETHQAKDI